MPDDQAHGHHDHADHRHDHASPDGADWNDFAELLELDGVVLHEHLREVTTWVRQLADDGPRSRVLDLGAGTGVAAIAFAHLFSASEIVAVDLSEPLLARIRAKALDQGLAGRVRTVVADLDAGWPAVGPVDVAWASNSVHHVTDPGRLLADAFAAIRPGGLLAVSEMDAPPRLLPHDLGTGEPGLEERCHAVIAVEHARSVPDLGADWAPPLEKAGFGPVTARAFALDVSVSDEPSVGRYARAYFQRVRPMLTDKLGADDLTQLDALLGDGPHSLLHRDDLAVRGGRTVWIAHRP